MDLPSSSILTLYDPVCMEVQFVFVPQLKLCTVVLKPQEIACQVGLPVGRSFNV